jgi:protein arginine N-methyltransferase 1
MASHDEHEDELLPNSVRESEGRELLSRRNAMTIASVGSSAALGSQIGASPAFGFLGLPEDEFKGRRARPALRTSWIATQGFSKTSRNFIDFNPESYKAMVDDQKRTPLFIEAIQKKFDAAPKESLVMLDLGCGPEALFAIIAAKAGAKKVYAIEGNNKIARVAAKAISTAEGKGEIPLGVVELYTGFSEDIELPQKVDFLVAEIAGSVASEEGAYASFRDAHRFLKDPSNPNAYIPYAMRTYGAPASYAIHYAFGPPAFDWAKLRGEPVRLNCRDVSMELLADPALVEELITSSEIAEKGLIRAPTREWKIDPDRVAANEKLYYAELLKESQVSTTAIAQEEAKVLARNVSRSMSGIAMWQEMVLDPEGTLVVTSRGPKGEPEKSHWQTVLPIIATRPVDVEPGDTVRGGLTIDIKDGKIGTPLYYTITVDVIPS